MFRRLQFESLQQGLAVFALFASVTLFLYFIYRMLRMKKERARELANLPLEEEEDNPELSHHEKGNSERKE
jgi:cbb3-type cytochrome oxidase subunit 3